jgi:triosephosphate isomerase
MNGSIKMIDSLVEQLNNAKLDGTTGMSPNCVSLREADETEVVVAPPAIYLLHVQAKLQAPTQVSAQNCFTTASGAFTGEISPNQLKDADIHWVILGHSERRSMFGDTDKFVAEKVKAAVEAGLGVIACVGESLEEREGNKTKEVVERQLNAIAGDIPESAWK